MESNLTENKVDEIEELCMDRISYLPNSILSKIVSYLPTKQAVTTSILSRNWKHVSPFDYLPININLEGEIFRYNDNRPHSFVLFMNKLLNTNVSSVESFSLRCDGGYTEELIVSWISSALKLNLRHLDMELVNGYYSFKVDEGSNLFCHLNGSTTLSYLKLSFSADYTYEKQLFVCPKNFTLPNIKSLQLYSMKFDNDACYNILRGCPVLEELVLNKIRLEVHSGTIRCLTSNLLKRLALVEVTDGRIDFHVPNLEHLTSSSGRRHIVGNLASLLGAYINGHRWPANELATFSMISSLHLSAYSIMSFQDSSVQIPLLQKLTYLSIGCLKLAQGFEILARFLRNAPFLEKLILDEPEHKYYQKDDIGGSANFNKASMLKPPICVERHMKEIKFFMVFHDERKDEIELMEYFLKNGKVLERLALYCLPLEDKSLKKRLHKLPRQSKILYEPKEKLAQVKKIRNDRVLDGDLINY